MPSQISPNGSAGGGLPAYAAFCGISPLTCTIFDPIYFGTILRNQISHISPTSLKKFIMGNYLDFALKIAHRGNTGSHKGKRKLACLSENYICALLLFFSVFGLWHKANSVFTSPKFPPIFQNKNFDLQLFFFRVNITHHEGDFFCFVSCVLQDVSISMKVSGVPLRNILCLTRSGQAIPLLHTWLLKRCVIPRKMLNS